MKAQIEKFCTEYEYPAEATASLLSDFDKIMASEYALMFKRHVDLYNSDDPLFSFDAVLSASKHICNCGVSSYAVDLLFFICFAEHCKEKYEKAGLPMAFYHKSMLDLKWKLMECIRVKGVWGSFVAFWFPRFFNLTRFAMGRLQFEIDPSSETYQKGDLSLGYGDWLVNMHIPSCGKLSIDECMDSLNQACEFYKDYFPDGIVKFRCNSWLLTSKHNDYIPENGGIRRFAALFDIAFERDNEKGSDLWRIFGKEYNGSTEGFPAETSLQRAYLKMLENGICPGYGRGYIFMKDGKIINK